MKKIIFQYVFFSICILSCSKDDDLLNSVLSPDSLSFNDSLKNWEILKRENGNSYVYENVNASVFGFGSITTITVKNGKVKERKFVAYRINDTTNEREITDSYIENEADLAVNEMGALPLTINQLYDTCARDYLRVNSNDNEIIFTTSDGTGIVYFCGYYPKGCADDCFRGFRIENFKWIND